MGEYSHATIYKPMRPVSPLSNTFDKTCWELYEARGDREKINNIYRKINFVTERGDIFNLNMRFLERDGAMYQTNTGVLGVSQLPELTLSYEFHLHDFWLSIVKPNELIMNEHDVIKVELLGKEIHDRFFQMKVANKKNESFKTSDIYTHYVEDGMYPSLSKLINEQDLVLLSIGHIYYDDNLPYKDAARKAITEQRKEIASQFLIPHWSKDRK